MFESLLQRVFLIEDHLYRLFVADSRRAYRLAGVVLLVLVLATMGLLFSTGAAPQRQDGRDAINLIDCTWRIVCGYRPHADFYDYFGITSALPLALGMLVCGSNCDALAYGPALLLPVLTLAAWWIAKRRFSAFTAAMIAALIGGLMVGTFPLGLGAGWRSPAYAMQYNRFEWALLSILVVLVLVRPRHARGRAATTLEGAIAGGLVGLLLLGKFNYAVGVVAVVGLGLPLLRCSRGFWLASFTTLASVLLFFVFYIRGDLAAFWADHAILAGCQLPSDRLVVLWRCALDSWPELGIPLFILAIHLRRFAVPEQAGGMARTAWIDILLVAAVFAVSFVVTTGNAQGYAIPLWALESMILAEIFGRPVAMRRLAEQDSPDKVGEGCRFRVGLGYLAASIALSLLVVPDFSSVAYAFVWKRYRAAQLPEDARIHAESLASMILPPTTYDPAEIAQIRDRMGSAAIPRNVPSYEYAIFVNDGLELLRGRTDANSRVYALDVNVFPFALQLPPAKGESCPWHLNRLADDAHHPPVSQIFAGVTHVMVSKLTLASNDVANFKFMHRQCDPYLEEHFVPAGESKFWILYTRKHDR